MQTETRAAPPPELVRVRTGLLQRKCACGGTPGFDGECSECRAKKLQRAAQKPSARDTVPPIVHEVLRSPGRPLDPLARAVVEPRFGHSFSRVRIHTDNQAAESAHAVNASAYTVGQQIVFGYGRYAPATLEGQKLLAHELVHTIQQSGDTSGVTRLSDPADASEREADSVAERIPRHHPPDSLNVREHPSASRLQRQDDGSADQAPAATAAAGSRPVFFCSKPILLSFLHGKRHAFFRIGGSGPGNDTFELEHGSPCPDCYQGFPKRNEPEDRDATDATCNAAPAITESALSSNWDVYPIGQYCAWGPNSNTYARVVAERCGGTGLRPPGDVPGFDDPPPSPGTFGPNPYVFSALGMCWSPGGCALCGQPEPGPPPEPSPA